MGQSSLTLPDCKVVIDFCLTRKSVRNKKTGYTKLITTYASKSSLQQRKGRVGRVSHGYVLRLIPKSFEQRLSDFDVPEIKLTTLENVILKIKKLAKQYKSGSIFDDPYDLLLETIQPPLLSRIQAAIKFLLSQDALKINNKKLKPKLGRNFNGFSLQLTQRGQFFDSLSCQIPYCKMILVGLKMKCLTTIVEIVALMNSTKDFFKPQWKRNGICYHLRNMLIYDKNQNNEFYLKWRIYNQWKNKFYQKFKKRTIYNIIYEKQIKNRRDIDRRQRNQLNSNKVVDENNLGIKKKYIRKEQVIKNENKEKKKYVQKQTVKNNSMLKQTKKKYISKDQKNKLQQYKMKIQLESFKNQQQLYQYQNKQLNTNEQQQSQTDQLQHFILTPELQLKYAQKISFSKFLMKRPRKNQTKWCQKMNIYPRSMRNILQIYLKLQSNLKYSKIQIKLEKNNNEAQVPNQLILLALTFGFSTLAQIKNLNIEQFNMNCVANQVFLKFNYKVDNLKEKILQYLQPFKLTQLQCQISSNNQNINYSRSTFYKKYLKIVGGHQIMKLLLTPTVYNMKYSRRKCQFQSFQKIIKKQKKIKNYSQQINKEQEQEQKQKQLQQYEQDAMYAFIKNETMIDIQKCIKFSSNKDVFNDSINKCLLFTRSSKKKVLIGNLKIETKKNSFYKNSALMDYYSFVVFLLISQKNVQLKSHFSKKYFTSVKTKVFRQLDLPYIGQQQFKKIIQYRNIFFEVKSSRIQNVQQNIFKQTEIDLNKFCEFLRNIKPKISMLDWEQKITNNYMNQQNYISIQQIKLNKDDLFILRYQSLLKYNSFLQRQIIKYTQKNNVIVCQQCLKQTVNVICSQQSIILKQGYIQTQYNHLKMVEIGQSQRKVYCKRNHLIGYSIDNANIALIPSKLKIIAPYCDRQFDIKVNKQQFEQMLDKIDENKNQSIKRLHQKYMNSRELTYVCQICNIPIIDKGIYIFSKKKQDIQDIFQSFIQQVKNHLSESFHINLVKNSIQQYNFKKMEFKMNPLL